MNPTHTHAPEVTEQLERLREEVRQVDAALVELIARRLELVEAIGRLKKAHGVPLRDWSVEKAVVHHALDRARALRVSEDLVRRVIQLLIEESRVLQERMHYTGNATTTESICIVGGGGQMGQWFAQFFADQGHRVWLYDVRGPIPGWTCVPTLEEGLQDATVALIATPLEVVPQVIRSIADTEFAGVVCDIASLKSHLQDAVTEARQRGLRITSIHPMFGPRTRTLTDKVIIVCDCGDPEATARVMRLFQDTAVTLVPLSMVDHDRMIAYILGLSHFINILYAALLAGSGWSFEQLQQIGSTTFLSQIATTETVVRENPDLYFAIQHLNPFTPALYAAIDRTLRELVEIVRNGYREQFRRVMERGRQWLNGDTPV